MQSHAVGYLGSSEARKVQIRVDFTGWWSKQVNMWDRGWMVIYIKCTSDRRQPANRLVGAKQVTMWMNVDTVNALIISSDFVARPFIRRSTVRVTHANFPNLAPVCLLIIKQLRRLGPLLLLKYFQVLLLLLLHGPIVLLPLYHKVH